MSVEYYFIKIEGRRKKFYENFFIYLCYLYYINKRISEFCFLVYVLNDKFGL